MGIDPDVQTILEAMQGEIDTLTAVIAGYASVPGTDVQAAVGSVIFLLNAKIAEIGEDPARLELLTSMTDIIEAA